MNIRSLLLGTAAALACVSLAHAADPFPGSPAITGQLFGSPQVARGDDIGFAPAQLASNETGLITANPGGGGGIKGDGGTAFNPGGTGGLKKPMPPAAAQTACNGSIGRKPCIPAPSAAQLAGIEGVLAGPQLAAGGPKASPSKPVFV